jgi:hypothetical protein
MSAKEVKFGVDARDRMLRGVDNVVGPKSARVSAISGPSVTYLILGWCARKHSRHTFRIVEGQNVNGSLPGFLH